MDENWRGRPSETSLLSSEEGASTQRLQFPLTLSWRWQISIQVTVIRQRATSSASEHSLRTDAEVLMVNFIQFWFAERGQLVRSWCKVKRVLVQWIIVHFSGKPLGQRHISILIVHTHRSQRLQMHVRSLFPLLLVVFLVIFYTYRNSYCRRGRLTLQILLSSIWDLLGYAWVVSLVEVSACVKFGVRCTHIACLFSAQHGLSTVSVTLFSYLRDYRPTFLLLWRLLQAKRVCRSYLGASIFVLRGVVISPLLTPAAGIFVFKVQVP